MTWVNGLTEDTIYSAVRAALANCEGEADHRVLHSKLGVVRGLVDQATMMCLSHWDIVPATSERKASDSTGGRQLLLSLGLVKPAPKIERRV